MPFYLPMIVTWALVMAVVTPSWAEVPPNSQRVWRRAQPLAVGQKLWSFQTSMSKARPSFGDKNARHVLWKELLNSENAAGRADLRTYMAQRGLSETDIAASSRFQIDRQDVLLNVDWAYGLTDAWTIGFQAPVLFRTTRIRSKVHLSPELAAGSGTKSQRSMLQSTLSEIRERVRAMTNEKIIRSGYDSVPEEQSTWRWGDITLLNRIEMLRRPDWNWALQPMVRFPAAPSPTLEDYFEQSSDEGQLDLGLTSLTDYRWGRWTLGLRFGFVAQLPDTVRMRLALQDEEGPSVIDNSVDRDLGDHGFVSIDAQWRLASSFDLSFEQSYHAKEKDKVDKASLIQTPYQELAQFTDREVLRSRFELLYNFGANGSRSGVTNEWQAALAYAVPWSVRNGSLISEASLEVITYF